MNTYAERHQKLIKRAQLLGHDTVKVAAGWVLKTLPGASGVNMALGLLALLDPSSRFMDKALQLRYLSAEALAFLQSSLDLAYILQSIPHQTEDDVERMRFSEIKRVTLFYFISFGGWDGQLNGVMMHAEYGGR